MTLIRKQCAHHNQFCSKLHYEEKLCGLPLLAEQQLSLPIQQGNGSPLLTGSLRSVCRRCTLLVLFTAKHIGGVQLLTFSAAALLAGLLGCSGLLSRLCNCIADLHMKRSTLS